MDAASHDGEEAAPGDAASSDREEAPGDAASADGDEAAARIDAARERL
ncbi:MAG: hypothetical protein ACR2LK_03935 [Solirubrobacteraceae bacterium]